MTTIIHHSADFDGLFCKEIAKKFLSEAQVLGWDFGMPQIPFPVSGLVYILDLPPECCSDIDFSRLIWIDHHKSSIEKWAASESIPGFRLDGVAACRLAWAYFSSNPMLRLPDKAAFLNRKVPEPYAVTLAGEYDVWDHTRSKNVDVTFQFGLRAQQVIDWDSLLRTNYDAVLESYLEQGAVIEQYSKKVNADVIEARGFDLEFEGLKFLALNTIKKSSLTFESGIKEHHDGCLSFSWDGNNKTWIVSMYGVPGKDIDLSEIAKKHGGGGHRTACGFQAKSLPWLT